MVDGTLAADLVGMEMELTMPLFADDGVQRIVYAWRVHRAGDVRRRSVLSGTDGKPEQFLGAGSRPVGNGVMTSPKYGVVPPAPHCGDAGVAAARAASARRTPSATSVSTVAGTAFARLNRPVARPIPLRRVSRDLA